MASSKDFLSGFATKVVNDEGTAVFTVQLSSGKLASHVSDPFSNRLVPWILWSSMEAL